jgi:signal transduction histidine kinase
VTRLKLGTRLAATFALLFAVAGAGVIALTVTLAVRSVDAANSASTPALDDLKAAIGEALQGQTPAPGPQTDPKAPLTAEQEQAQKHAAALAEAETKQRLLHANEAYAAATSSDAQRRLILWSALAAAVFLPAAAAAGWVLARRALRPLQEMTRSVSRVSGSSLSERIAMTGPDDEITELAAGFDAMLERLEHAFDAQRRFSADASHELRTPLAVAGAAVDVVLAKPDPATHHWRTMATDVRAALDRAEEVLAGLLALTRTQYLDHRREPTDLAALATDALDAQAAALEGIDVEHDLAPAPVLGDPALLERLIANLVENAGRHNVPGGFARITTTVTDDHAIAVVENSGAELTAEQAAALVTPFHRASGRARSSDRGLGLGLAIASAVVAAHHGTLTVEPRTAGGLVVTVRLPLLR